jgi:hypothetical protein
MKTQLNKRGSILVMSIFFMLILFITASAFLVLLPVENRAAIRTEQIAQGGLVADAGINDSLAWLREQLQPKDNSASREPMASGVYPSEANRTVDMGNGWTYRWELTPDAETFPNGSNSVRAYTITSKAFRDGVIFRQAQAEVIQDSLSEYAALYDFWPSNLVSPIESTSAPAGGPVHVNDPDGDNSSVMRLWIKEGASFWGSAGDPKYSHGLTASGSANTPDGFVYYQGSGWGGSNPDRIPYDNNGPIESRYARMAEGGRNNMQAGGNNVDLPENTFELRDAAWGFNATNPVPTSNGVYVNEVNSNAQGIYIEGDVEEMQLGFGGTEATGSNTVNYGSNSWVKVEQPGGSTNSIDDSKNYTVITVKDDPVVIPAGSELNGSSISSPTTIAIGNTLLKNPDGSFDSYSGELNGVVYTNGDIDNLWGTNKGKRTITVAGDEANNISHTIRIGGRENDSNGQVSVAVGEKGLIQFGATDSDSDGVLDPPSNADNVVGLIGRDVMISSDLKRGGRWDTSHPSNNPLYLYAIVLGGITGDGGTYAVESYGSGGAGWAYRYGSRIMVDAGAWGTTSGHGLVEGNTFYDEPASSSPPPYFPSQPTFTLKSYVELPALDGETL